MRLSFVDGNEPRAAELRRLAPSLELELVGLTAGYSTSAPDPSQRARDKVAAAATMVNLGDDAACFAEGVDLVTLDGKSLRLELDSENEGRFCRYWRETAVRLVVALAVRRPGADVELIVDQCEGRIADRPAGPRTYGWDRLFVPAGFTRTLAEIADAAIRGPDADPVGLRTRLAERLVAALGA